MLIDAEDLQGYINSTPEQRKNFWKALEDYCDANNIAKVFYCPYIPLQIYKGETTLESRPSFKTRYGVID